MTPEEMAHKCLRNEADVYRKALIRLWSDASSGQRKTLDKAEVERIAGTAIDVGNAWHRRGKETAA